MTYRKTAILSAMMTGSLILASCAANQANHQASQAPTGIHEISALYDKAMQHHPREVRKPLQEQQARYLRLLAEKTETFIAETKGWDSDARLTAINPADRDNARNKVRAFRDSLEALKGAAEKTDTATVESKYKAVMSSYRDLNRTVAVPQ
jgi:hypothetical protein